MAKVNPIPPGSHTLTPGLVIKGALAAIEFYKQAFGAREISKMLGPNGGVMHAELMIGDSKIYLGDEFPEMGAVSPHTLHGSPVSLNLYTEDCDAMFARAVAAGATVKMPLTDMFWGDRYGKVTDPFGHHWGISSRVEEVSEAEMIRRGKEWMDSMANK